LRGLTFVDTLPLLPYGIRELHFFSQTELKHRCIRAHLLWSSYFPLLVGILGTVKEKQCERLKSFKSLTKLLAEFMCNPNENEAGCDPILTKSVLEKALFKNQNKSNLLIG
jgi:hypothetical protein